MRLIQRFIVLVTLASALAFIAVTADSSTNVGSGFGTDIGVITRSSTGPPLIIYAEGCSGSTIIGKLTRLLLSEVGIWTMSGGTKKGFKATRDTDCQKWLHNDWESTKENKNCFLQKALLLAKASGKISSESRANIERAFISDTQDAVQKKRKRWLVNPPPLTDAMAESFKALGGRVVHMYRENILDRMICEVRDCFSGPPKGSFPVYLNGSRAA